MRKIMIQILFVCILLGCQSTNEQTNNQEQVVDQPIDIVENNDKELYEKIMLAGYLVHDGYDYFYKEVNEMYYILSPKANKFEIISIYDDTNYQTNIDNNTNAYAYSILENELFNMQIDKNELTLGNESVTVQLGKKTREFINIYQLLNTNGFQEFEGKQYKEYSFGTVFFDLKRKQISIDMGNNTIHAFLNQTMYQYSYKDGECKYNPSLGISTNCYSKDIKNLEETYFLLKHEVLEPLGLLLIDLDNYYQRMIELGKWEDVSYTYPIYPRMNENIIYTDSDIPPYVNKVMQRRNGTIYPYSIEVNYRSKKAAFYFEDKTFTYEGIKGVYDFCDNIVINGEDELATIYYRILNDFGLNSEELQIYANTTRLYDKTLGGSKDVE